MAHANPKVRLETYIVSRRLDSLLMDQLRMGRDGKCINLRMDILRIILVQVNLFFAVMIYFPF